MFQNCVTKFIDHMIIDGFEPDFSQNCFSGLLVGKYLWRRDENRYTGPLDSRTGGQPFLKKVKSRHCDTVSTRDFILSTLFPIFSIFSSFGILLPIFSIFSFSYQLMNGSPKLNIEAKVQFTPWKLSRCTSCKPAIWNRSKNWQLIVDRAPTMTSRLVVTNVLSAWKGVCLVLMTLKFEIFLKKKIWTCMDGIGSWQIHGKSIFTLNFRTKKIRHFVHRNVLRIHYLRTGIGRISPKCGKNVKTKLNSYGFLKAFVPDF